MTLQELRYLVALADHRHFGRAAAACHVSQPTLSTQLKKLEAFLGTALFERTNKTVDITPAGAPIVAKARRVLAEAESLVALARAQTGPLVGPLRLGVIPTLGPYLLPWLVPALTRAYPQLRLIVDEDLTDRLIERIEAHKCDAALVALPVGRGDLETRALFDEPFFYVGQRGRTRTKGKAVDPATLGGADLLLLTDGHCLRDQALAACGLTQAPDGGDFRATSLETIRQMVAAGMGCSLFPALALDERAGARLDVRRLAPAASRRIGLVWRSSYPKAADLELLAGIVRAHLPRSVRAA